MTIHTLADIADLQSTIDAAQAGDTIILPGETLSIPEHIVYIDGLTIAGQDGTLVQASGARAAFDVSGRSDIVIRSIAFELDSGAHAVRADGAAGLTIEHLTVRSNFATAETALIGGLPIRITNSDAVSVTGCDIANTFGGIYLVDCRDALVANNTITDIGYGGVNVTGERIVVDTNTITNAGTNSSDGLLGGGDGITVGAGNAITLNGNIITNGLCYQINVAGAVTNMTVTNNVMRGAFTSSMYFIDVAGLELSGNSFAAGHWLGVTIETGREIRIVDNSFDQAAVWFAADVWDAEVADNVFIDAAQGVVGRGSMYASNAIEFADGAVAARLPVLEIAADGQVRLSALLAASDLGAGDYLSYRLLDAEATSGSAYFDIGGHAVVGDGGVLTLAASQVGSAAVEGGTAARFESMWLSANDGSWNDWREVVVRTMEADHFPNRAPLMEARAITLDAGARVPGRALLAAFDEDGDPILAYHLLNRLPGTGAAQIRLDGQPAAEGEIVTVYANELRDPARLTFSAGDAAGTQVFYAQAYDGQAWSDWQEITVTTLVDKSADNLAPGVLTDTLVLDNGTEARLAESVRSFDSDADPISFYRVLISEAGPGSATLEVGGVSHDGSTGAITLSAAAFRDACIGAAAHARDQIMWVQAYDGVNWSEWAQFNVDTVDAGTLGNLGPSVIETSVTMAAGATVKASDLIKTFDREGDHTLSYRFLAAGNAQADILVGGVVRDNALGKLTVQEASLSSISFALGEDSTSYLYAQGYDGQDWGEWFRITLIGDPGLPGT